ncbi:MAG: hypothetical protein ABI559_05215 [Chloroflexota bacterium]
MGWRTMAAALDAGTAVCSGLNAAYFFDRLLSGGDARARRVAVFVLTIVSFGTMIEALALIASAGGSHDAPVAASAGWAMVRVLPLAGSAGISALIARGAWFR